MSRSTSRELLAGWVALIGIGVIAAVFVIGSGGPGFFSPRRTIDVLFRNGQSIRIGSPVRVAGLETGRVTAVDLAEVNGLLQARVRLSIPAELAAKLRQDVKISIESGLTGQSQVNIVSSGQSDVPLVTGQLVEGIETSFFDPILEQVGMGPVERSHLSHTIAQVRQTVDDLGPRLRNILATLDQTASGVQTALEETKPKLVSSATHLEQMTQKITEADIAAMVQRLDRVSAEIEKLLTETRPQLTSTLAHAESLTRSLDQTLIAERPRITKFIDSLDGTRQRADRVLANAEVISHQGASIITKNRGDIERILANVNQASDYGVKLVQKLFGNPFYLSPFYKPTPADIQAQAVYDATTAFMDGAKELNDGINTLRAMQGKPMTPVETDAYNRLYARIWNLVPVIKQTQAQLAEGLRAETRR
jgi:phospholipid/cholesterol/gamma-HCH transport system substrate-binding protein